MPNGKRNHDEERRKMMASLRRNQPQPQQSVCLTHFVEQGHYAYLRMKNSDLLGTSGIGPCVGLIVTYDSGVTLCAHIDHDIQSNNKVAVARQTRIAFSGKVNGLRVIAVHCASPSARTPLTGGTIDGIKDYFGRVQTFKIYDSDAIYVNAEGEVFTPRDLTYKNRISDGKLTVK